MDVHHGEGFADVETQEEETVSSVRIHCAIRNPELTIVGTVGGCGSSCSGLGLLPITFFELWRLVVEYQSWTAVGGKEILKIMKL